VDHFIPEGSLYFWASPHKVVLNALVGGVEGVDPEAKRRVEFFTKMLTDAFSPSNFLLSNPAALKAAWRPAAKALCAGAEQFARDMERGGGQLAISLTDVERFEVGVDVATAPRQGGLPQPPVRAAAVQPHD
jgi:polyhydroxyalkanoate synthase